LGANVQTAADAMSRSQTYFLVAKISSQGAGAGKFDQISMTTFASGASIPNTDSGLNWTLVGATGQNSSAVLERIAILGGSQATWSVDDVRLGSTFGAVASNRAGGEFPNGVSGDVNQDGLVSGDGTGPPAMDDVSAFLRGWQTSTAGLPPLERVRFGDLDLNGKVDLEDVKLLRNSLLIQGQSLNLPRLPEPSSASLAFAGALAWMLYCR
jgi:hypothetical protein